MKYTDLSVTPSSSLDFSHQQTHNGWADGGGQGKEPFVIGDVLVPEVWIPV